MVKKKENRRVFISYSSVDYEIAKSFKNYLDSLNIPCFVAGDGIQWGQKFNDVIQKNIERCSHLLIIISPGSEQSQYVDFEIGLAKALKKKILPFLSHPSMKVPSFINDLQYITKKEKVYSYFSEPEINNESFQEYNEILAKCRLYTNNQIQLHARKKYIPEIYINRKIEGELFSHHKSEIEQLNLFNKQFKNHIKSIRSILQNTIKIIPDELHDEKKGKESFLINTEVKIEYTNCIKSNILLLKTIENIVPKTNIYKFRDNYKIAITELKNFISHLKSARSLEYNLYKKSITQDKKQVYDKIIQKQSEKFGLDRATSIAEILVELIIININPVFLLIERAGGGKTNILCHLSKLLSENEPTLIIFGKLPISTKDDLFKTIAFALGCPLDTHPISYIERIDKILEEHRSCLHIIIDGINENRSISNLNQALAELIIFSWQHRIKISISCRDIYWGFFDDETWQPYISKISKDLLYYFSIDEYEKVLPLYLQHYNIKGRLIGNAFEACRHPLLLRFFCEAYGNIDGEIIDIGCHNEIRLKELFDLYFKNKTDSLARSFENIRIETVEKYIYHIAESMLNAYDKYILSNNVFGNDSSINPEIRELLYIRLLDEDIIIDETPTKDVLARKVSFVYEEFMEYIMARYILQSKYSLKDLEINSLFEFLDKTLEKWINARGIGEYVTNFLISADDINTHQKGIELLMLMASGNSHWKSAYWSIISKTEHKHPTSYLYSSIPIAISHLDNDKHIDEVLQSISRQNKQRSIELASLIFWSALLPPIFNLTSIESLDNLLETNNLMDEVVINEFNIKFGPSSLIHEPSLRRIWKYLFRYLSEDDLDIIDKKMNIYGKDLTHLNLLRVGWKINEKNRILIVNGLFHEEYFIRKLASDRIRFCDTFKKAICKILQISILIETNTGIKAIKLDSLKMLRQ